MADPELKRWVSDQLHDVMGLSERNVVDYLIASAKKASSPDAFAGMVESGGLDVTPALRTFTDELWGRLPHAAAVPLAQRPAAMHNRQLLAERVKNASYKLLESSDEDIPKTSQAEESKRDKRKRKHRKRAESSESDSDDAIKRPTSKRRAGQFGLQRTRGAKSHTSPEGRAFVQ